MAIQTRLFALAAAAGIAWVGASNLLADTLFIRASTGSGVIEVRGITVTGIEGGKLIFRAPAGPTSRDLAQIVRIFIDDEPALNSAEIAFAAEQYDTAADDYLRFQKSTAKTWLKPYSAVRLMTSATRAGRFEAAVSAYLDLVLNDPKFARENRPVIDPAAPPKPGILDAAIAEVDKALAKPTTLEQKQALLRLQVDLMRARGDSARTAKLLEQLTAMGPAGNSGDPAAAKALTDLRLTQASVALDSGDFAKAAGLIEQNRSIFTSPPDQAEALYILAASREGSARAAKDKVKLLDASLAYMRVVAHFKDTQAAKARVPISMLQAAKILEELGDRAGAVSLYTDLSVEAPTAELKNTAREALERLK